MVDFQFSNTITHSSQRLNITKPSNDPNVRILHPPSRAKAFGRIVLNVITLGEYTKLDNTKQWEEFYKALEESIPTNSTNDKKAIENLFHITYMMNEALTHAKVNNVLATLKAWQEGAESTTVGGVDGGQNVLHGDGSGANVQTRDVRTLAERFPSSGKETKENIDKFYRYDNSCVFEEIVSRATHILDHQDMAISNDAIIHGQEVLKKQAASKNQSLEYTKIGLSGSTLREVVEKITEKVEPISLKMDALREKGSEGKSAILSIPLRLKRTSQLHEEDHLILIAVDFKTKKILYLDPKATSLDLAHKKYQEQGNDFRGELTQLGRKLFGESFESKTDILELSSPKQKRSSDAGAFIHFFTRAILDDCSPYEIDTNFGIATHADIRMHLVTDIWNSSLKEVFGLHAIENSIIPIPLDELSGKDKVQKNKNRINNTRDELSGENIPRRNYIYELATQEEIADRFDEMHPSPRQHDTILKTSERIKCTWTEDLETYRCCHTNSDNDKKIYLSDEGTLPRSFLMVFGENTLNSETASYSMRTLDLYGMDWGRFMLQLGDDEQEKTTSAIRNENETEESDDSKKERIKKMGEAHGLKSEKQIKELQHALNSHFTTIPDYLCNVSMNVPYGVRIKDQGKLSSKPAIRNLCPVLGEERAFYASGISTRWGSVLQVQQDNIMYDFIKSEEDMFLSKSFIKAKIVFPEDDSMPTEIKILSIKYLLEVKPKEPMPWKAHCLPPSHSGRNRS